MLLFPNLLLFHCGNVLLCFGGFPIAVKCSSAARSEFIAPFDDSASGDLLFNPSHENLHFVENSK